MMETLAFNELIKEAIVIRHSKNSEKQGRTEMYL